MDDCVNAVQSVGQSSTQNHAPLSEDEIHSRIDLVSGIRSNRYRLPRMFWSSIWIVLFCISFTQEHEPHMKDEIDDVGKLVRLNSYSWNVNIWFFFFFAGPDHNRLWLLFEGKSAPSFSISWLENCFNLYVAVIVQQFFTNWLLNHHVDNNNNICQLIVIE